MKALFFIFSIIIGISLNANASVMVCTSTEALNGDFTEKITLTPKPVNLVIPGKLKSTTILTDGEGHAIGLEIKCKGRNNTCIQISTGGTSNYTLTTYDNGAVVGSYNVASYTQTSATIDGDPQSTIVTASY